MFTDLQNALPRLETLYDKRLLLVTSLGKSGSTWVQKILDGHPAVLCAGEAKLRHMLGPVNKALIDYNKQLNLTNRVVYGDNNEFRAWGKTHFNITAQFLVALAFATMGRAIPPAVTYVGNKDTDYIYDFPFWHEELLPEAKFIHIIRDVRDVVVSNIHHHNRQGAAIEPGSGKYYEVVQKTAEGWGELVARAHDTGAATPETYHEVKYEALLDKPQETAGQIFSYLGLDTADDTVARCVADASFEKLSGGRQRGQEDRGSFYRKGVSGDWKTELDTEARRIIDRCAGPLLARLGYPAC